jgi:7-carboxy-7-deazaguanine synthase
MPSDSLTINEIFQSVQGESSYAGLRCVFVRLTGCHLRCSYCDTEYAFHEGRRRSLDDILAEVDRWQCDLVEITGGEPLLQPNVYPLMTRLLDSGKTVLLETSGSISVEQVDQRVVKIMDFKCPSSGQSHENLFENIRYLNFDDEVKFVIGTRQDYEWTRSILDRHRLADVCRLLVSPVFGVLEPVRLAEWVLADRLPVRLQLQLHKFIWPPDARGV